MGLEREGMVLYQAEIALGKTLVKTVRNPCGIKF
jgi:hypothetical protein